MLKNLWNDESGFIVSAELVIIATIVVIGLVVGLSAVRDAVNSELGDVAFAINNFDQTFTVAGVTGHSAAVAPSFFQDSNDFCDAGGTANTNACIVNGGTAAGLAPLTQAD